MKIYKSINEFNTLKSNLPALTLVPTMGNLHMGHISLIKAAKKVNNPIISTIYINKLQFNDKNDYLKYPKTLDDDIELLDKHGCDFLLIPDDSILENIPSIKAPNKSKKLCGMNRPGHFDGVLTIVNKLFNIVNPHSVVFGKKDYQQLILIKDFIKQNKFNINVISAETQRDVNGLALSSRNNLLSKEEKLIASKLYEVLVSINKNKNILTPRLLNEKIEYLNSVGFKVDYLTACDTNTLEESFEISKKDILIAIAAKIGNIRLIDNMILSKL